VVYYIDSRFPNSGIDPEYLEREKSFNKSLFILYLSGSVLGPLYITFLPSTSTPTFWPHPLSSLSATTPAPPPLRHGVQYCPSQPPILVLLSCLLWLAPPPPLLTPTVSALRGRTSFQVWVLLLPASFWRFVLCGACTSNANAGEDHCRKAQLPLPVFQVVSDRRGKYCPKPPFFLRFPRYSSLGSSTHRIPLQTTRISQLRGLPFIFRSRSYKISSLV
jgi:hypothetical protein